MSVAEELVTSEEDAEKTVIEVPQNATHWRIWRRYMREEDGALRGERLSWQEKTTSPRLSTWPIAEFSPLLCVERWGDGAYLLRFYQEQPEDGKMVFLVTHERMVLGVPSDEPEDEPEDEDEDEEEDEDGEPEPEEDETGNRVKRAPPAEPRPAPSPVQVPFGTPYTSVPGASGAVHLPPADLPPHLNVPLPAASQIAGLAQDPATQALQLLTYHLSMWDRINAQAERRLAFEAERIRVESAAALERERMSHQAQLTMQAQVHQQQIESSRAFVREARREPAPAEGGQHVARAIRDAVREAMQSAEDRFEQRLEVAEAKAEQSTGAMAQVMKVVEALGPDVIRAVLPAKAPAG